MTASYLNTPLQRCFIMIERISHTVAQGGVLLRGADSKIDGDATILDRGQAAILKDEFSVNNPPDRSISIFRHKECAVVCDGHSYGSSPHFGVVGDKSGEKILVFPGRRSVFQANSDDFIARASGSIPRSMFGRESITPIFRRKHIAIVKRHP
jgi:hypothetical protein